MTMLGYRGVSIFGMHIMNLLLVGMMVACNPYKSRIVSLSESLVERSHDVCGGLKGAIARNDGSPVNNAAIILVGDGSGLTYSAVSNYKGEFQLCQASAGVYTLIVQYSGLRTLIREGLVVGPDRVLEVSIRLDNLGEQRYLN